jgi:hypothetical protein
MKRVTFRQGNVIIVFTLGKTKNKKIAPPNVNIVQTYSYSRAQFEEAQNKTSMHLFFSLDKEVCLDCPFAMNNGAKLGDCYTHKMNQYMGFLSQLRSIKREFGDYESIPPLNWRHKENIIEMATQKYVRFGSYGEPSLIPIEVVRSIVMVASNWTGYTHQWQKKPEYSNFFMASNHSAEAEKIAKLEGWLSFVASDDQTDLVSCPASKEMGFKSNCAKCGLCSGTDGKGKYSTAILLH